MVYLEEENKLMAAEKVNHNISGPILGLTVTGKPSDTIQIIAKGDNRRFFFPISVLVADLAQPYSRQQAVAQTASILCVER